MFCQQGGSLNSSLNKPRDNTKPNKRRSPRSQRSLNSGLMCSKLGASQSLTRLQWTRLQTANSACCFSLIFGKLRTTKIHFTLARPALASSNSTASPMAVRNEATERLLRLRLDLLVLSLDGSRDSDTSRALQLALPWLVGAPSDMTLSGLATFFPRNFSQDLYPAISGMATAL